MQEAKVKSYRMTPEEIKKRYGAPGEYAETKTPVNWRLNNDIYDHKEEAIRRMAQGKRKPKENK